LHRLPAANATMIITAILSAVKKNQTGGDSFF
jgi:hypothetical protein